MTSTSSSPNARTIALVGFLTLVPLAAAWRLLIGDQVSVVVDLSLIGCFVLWLRTGASLVQQGNFDGVALVEARALEPRIARLIDSTHLGSADAVAASAPASYGGLERISTTATWTAPQASAQASVEANSDRSSRPGADLFRFDDGAGLKPPPTAADSSPARPSTKSTTHLVSRGETYWALAVRFLGDGNRWAELRDLNIGRSPEPDVVLAPDHSRISAGWAIAIPFQSKPIDKDLSS